MAKSKERLADYFISNSASLFQIPGIVNVSLFVLVEHLGTTDEVFLLTISLVIVCAESCGFIHIY